VNFTISFPFKFQPGPMAVKQIVESGELGKINYIRFRNCHAGSIYNFLPEHFYKKEQCGGGAMIDLGAHGMYLIDWLAGLPEKYSSVFTHCFGRDVEDNAVTVMGYPSGLIAVNETGFVSAAYPSMLEVGGENGCVRFVSANQAAVIKSTKETNGEVAIDLKPAEEPPIIRFLKNEHVPGCGIEEAKHLTIMMQNAYSAII
jgi:predicted dehydrogenase